MILIVMGLVLALEAWGLLKDAAAAWVLTVPIAGFMGWMASGLQATGYGPIALSIGIGAIGLFVITIIRGVTAWTRRRLEADS